MMEKETLLDFARLREMIREGMSSLNKDPSADEAVLLIGDTGVGKSTLLAFLLGTKLTVKQDGLKAVLDGGGSIKIGHDKFSETSVPNKTLIGGVAFYDCPGFRDNKGEEFEIANSFFVQRLLDVYPRVKLVLMVDESHVSEARADKLPKLLRNLLRSFRTFEDIRDGVLMIINRAERGLVVQNYHRELLKMSELRVDAGPLFDPEAQRLLQFLISKGRICLFYQPIKEGKGQIFQPTANEKSIMPSIQRCDFVRSKRIQNILSESAKLAIRDFVDDLTAKAGTKVEQLCHELVATLSQKIRSMSGNISALIGVKQSTISLAEKVRAAKQNEIVLLLQEYLPPGRASSLQEDVTAVLFFKSVYDKTATFFSNLVNRVYAQLAHFLSKVDGTIVKAQRENEIRVEKQRAVQRRQQRRNERERQFAKDTEEIGRVKQSRQQAESLTANTRDLLAAAQRALGEIKRMQPNFDAIRNEVSKIQSKQDMNNTRTQSLLSKRFQFNSSK